MRLLHVQSSLYLRARNFDASLRSKRSADQSLSCFQGAAGRIRISTAGRDADQHCRASDARRPAPTASSAAVTTPPNWEPQPLSQMRQASFLVKGDNGAVADISFVSLGAAAGNVLDNVNRWLDQLGQPPITEQKLERRLRSDCALRWAMSSLSILQDFRKTPIQQQTAESLLRW